MTRPAAPAAAHAAALAASPATAATVTAAHPAARPASTAGGTTGTTGTRLLAAAAAGTLTLAIVGSLAGYALPPAPLQAAVVLAAASGTAAAPVAQGTAMRR